MSKEISLQQPGRRVTIGLHEKKEKLNNPIKTTKRLLRYIGSKKISLIIIFLLCAVTTLISILGTRINGIVVDKYISIGDISGLFKICIILVIMYIVSTISTFIQNKLMVNVAQSTSYKIRKDLYDKYNYKLSPFELTKKAKKMLLGLYEMLPTSGRLSYDSENMKSLQQEIDKITDFLLCGNARTYKSYIDFQDKLNSLYEWQNERDYASSNKYKEDMFRRLGNKNIQTALEIGKLRDKTLNQEIFNSRQRYFEKKIRAKQLDYLLDCLAYYAKLEEQQIQNFKAYFEHLEYMRKKTEYENFRHTVYEM